MEQDNNVNEEQIKQDTLDGITTIEIKKEKPEFPKLRNNDIEKSIAQIFDFNQQTPVKTESSQQLTTETPVNKKKEIKQSSTVSKLILPSQNSYKYKTPRKQKVEQVTARLSKSNLRPQQSNQVSPQKVNKSNLWKQQQESVKRLSQIKKRNQDLENLGTSRSSTPQLTPRRCNSKPGQFTPRKKLLSDFIFKPKFNLNKLDIHKTQQVTNISLQQIKNSNDKTELQELILQQKKQICILKDLESKSRHEDQKEKFRQQQFLEEVKADRQRRAKLREQRRERDLRIQQMQVDKKAAYDKRTDLQEKHKAERRLAKVDRQKQQDELKRSILNHQWLKKFKELQRKEFISEKHQIDTDRIEFIRQIKETKEENVFQELQAHQQQQQQNDIDNLRYECLKLYLQRSDAIESLNFYN